MELEKLKNNLKESFKTQNMYFAYRKKDGKIRLAIGTTNLKDIPENLHPSGKIESSDESVRYYDICSEGWRSFKPENLLWVERYGCVDEISDNDLEYLAKIAMPY